MKVQLRVGALIVGTIVPGMLAQAPLKARVAEDFGQVRLDVTVMGAGGLVAGLGEQDFSVRDNKAPVTITSFRKVTKEPVTVVVLIDAVNIPFTTVSFVRNQVEQYLRADGGKLAEPTAVAVLTDMGAEIQPGFTKDGNQLAGDLAKKDIGLRAISRAGGFAGAEERLQISLKAIDQLARYGQKVPGRKFVIWVSPGWPLLSGTDPTYQQRSRIFEDVVHLSAGLRESRTTIYSVNPLGAQQNLADAELFEEFTKGLSKAAQALPGNLGLPVLAIQSGGLALEGSTDIVAMLRRSVSEAGSWYEIGFAMPADAKKVEYRHLEVKVDRPRVEVRTRDGYYTP